MSAKGGCLQENSVIDILLNILSALHDAHIGSDETVNTDNSHYRNDNNTAAAENICHLLQTQQNNNACDKAHQQGTDPGGQACVLVYGRACARKHYQRCQRKAHVHNDVQNASEHGAVVINEHVIGVVKVDRRTGAVVADTIADRPNKNKRGDKKAPRRTKASEILHSLLARGKACSNVEGRISAAQFEYSFPIDSVIHIFHPTVS